MKAIHNGEVKHIADHLGDGVTFIEGGRADFGDPDLIVDPTDEQVEAAEQHRPIPPDPDDMLVVWPDGREFYLTPDRWAAQVLLDLGATLYVPATEERLAALRHITHPEEHTQ